MSRLEPIRPGDHIIPVDAPRGNHHREMVSMLTSALIHALLLALLAFLFFPSVSSTRQELTLSVGESELYPLESMNLSIDPTPLLPTSVDAVAEVEINVEILPMELSFEQADTALKSPVTNDLPPATSIPASFSAESLTTATSVEGAVDQITTELMEKLQRGDLLVVWLLDSSHSLVDDRQRVAAHLTPFYERLANGRDATQHLLSSAVVSFGQRMKQRVAPASFGDKIIRAVEDLPIDRSGKENVFEAVTQCAEHYRASWPDTQIAMVIWTDESGDDVRYLESSIEACRSHHVSVSVVGPSAVLGAETGFHSYTDPQTNSQYQLPVRRGPESVMPERIELGYWFLTRWERGRDGRRGPLPSWLGGQDLQGILSGFSPHALTRLAMQTGGKYTIFDRDEDRGPFDPPAMIEYAPCYGTYDDYKASIKSSPLRTGIIKAVDELAGKKVDAPPTMFFIQSTGPRVFDFVRFYYPPAEFQAKMRSSRGRLISQSNRYSRLVEAALLHVSSDDDPEVGMENWYESEPSPRWRAWYDLTRGRLLATSVRLEEYRLTLTELAQLRSLAGTTNHVILTASPETRSSGKFVNRAKEAERLLRRCARENRGTPWEILAQRELDFALGVGVLERALTQQPLGPVMRQPNLPRF